MCISNFSIYCIFILFFFTQKGPCGSRLCLEFTSGTIQKKETSNEYVFQQSLNHDFVIELSFTTIQPKESLVEINVKHNDDAIVFGDKTRFRPMVSNIRSLTGRYNAFLAPNGNFVFILRSLNKEYAEGVYTITSHYRVDSRRGDERFEKFTFTFGIKGKLL